MNLLNAFNSHSVQNRFFFSQQYYKARELVYTLMLENSFEYELSNALSASGSLLALDSLNTTLYLIMKFTEFAN